MNHFDSFEKFFNSLSESYNSDVDIKWIDRNDNLIGLFSINNIVYQINCINKGNDIWTYKFYLYDSNLKELSPDITNFNTGKMSILSTIRKGMLYLIDNKTPKCLIFGSLDKSEGRKKLYSRYSNEIKELYGYELHTSQIDNKKVFVLVKDIEFYKVEKIVNELIDEILNDI